MTIRGKVRKFGDNVNTDDIIAAQYLVTTEPQELGKHCMEHLRPNFTKEIEKGDIIVAGKYFGCGSSREHAPLAILGCGISAVVAKSFASIFFRNSINIGLPILECKEADEIKENDILEIDLGAGIIKNLTQNKSYVTSAFPQFLQKIIAAGGLINYLKKEKR
ncbi:MAG: 3-isopropylmalate dehydratase small subunit [Candidatus Omnitrophica bacterium]|nr:3-isopropylmalate dehydratase small subunit [Candidatus Omnitrophota bacterium]